MQKLNDHVYYTRRAGATRAQAERCEDARAKLIYRELADLYDRAANNMNAMPPAR